MLTKAFNPNLPVGTQLWETTDGRIVQLQDLGREHLSNIYWMYRTKLHAQHQRNLASSAQDLQFANALRAYIVNQYGGPAQYNPQTPDEVEVLRWANMLRSNGSIFIGGELIGYTNITLPDVVVPIPADPKSTRLYNNFTQHPSKLPLDNQKVNKLKKAIAANNVLHENPIIIDENNVILDGNYRYQAARELGLPIYFEVEQTRSNQVVRNTLVSSAPKASTDPSAVQTSGNPAIHNLLRKSGIPVPQAPAPAQPVQAVSIADNGSGFLQALNNIAPATDLTDAEKRLDDRAVMTWAMIRQDLNIGDNPKLNERAVNSIRLALTYAYEQGEGAK